MVGQEYTIDNVYNLSNYCGLPGGVCCMGYGCGYPGNIEQGLSLVYNGACITLGGVVQFRYTNGKRSINNE